MTLVNSFVYNPAPMTSAKAPSERSWFYMLVLFITFLPLDATHKRGLCCRVVSVCLSVFPSCWCIVSKRVNIFSNFFSLSGSFQYEILWQYTDEDPIMRTSNACGIKNRDFWPISGFIKEMIQDRVIVTTERQWELVCDLPSGAIFNYLEWPLTQIPRSRHYLKLNISNDTI